MDAGEHNDIGVGARRLARQRQAVADDVGDRVKNFGDLIVVRQDDRVALILEFEDGGDVISQDRPSKGGMCRSTRRWSSESGKAVGVVGEAV